MAEVIIRRLGRDFGSKSAYHAARKAKGIKSSEYLASLEKNEKGRTNYTNRGVRL